MNNISAQIGQVFDCLKGCSMAQLPPMAAQQALRDLPGPWPTELLWEQEGFDGSYHYDVLIRLPDGSVASVSHSPAHTLPWPMRGVHRHSESQLLRVNSTVMRFDQAVAWLDVAWKETRLAQRLVHVCLLRDHLKKHPVALTDAELQTAMDELRRTHGLCSAEATHAWMAREGLNQERFEWMVTELAQTNKLCEQVCHGRVEAYFEQHKHLFDTFVLARLQCGTQDEALAVQALLARGDADLACAARLHFMAQVDMGAAEPRFALQRVQRRQLPQPLAEVVASPPDGRVLGPVAHEGQWLFAEVLSAEPARLNAATRQAIKERLFGEWLGAQQRQAKVEWYWGERQYTDLVG